MMLYITKLWQHVKILGGTLVGGGNPRFPLPVWIPAYSFTFQCLTQKLFKRQVIIFLTKSCWLLVYFKLIDSIVSSISRFITVRLWGLLVWVMITSKLFPYLSTCLNSTCAVTAVACWQNKDQWLKLWLIAAKKLIFLFG